VFVPGGGHIGVRGSTTAGLKAEKVAGWYQVREEVVMSDGKLTTKGGNLFNLVQVKEKKRYHGGSVKRRPPSRLGLVRHL